MSCAEGGCDGGRYARGLCKIHYLRAYHRDELPPRATDLERLAKFITHDEGGCWLWTGSLDKHGYGRSYLNGRNRSAHAVMYELTIGPCPDGLELDHLCHVRNCVNPTHLEPVTHAENLRRATPRKKKAECKNGHPRAGLPIGAPCRTCKAEWQRERRRQLTSNTTQPNNTKETS